MYNKRYGKIKLKDLPNKDIISAKELKICCDKTRTEADLQKEVVKKLRGYKDLFIIYNDPVSPTMKFISDPKMRMAFVQYSKARGWEKGTSDLLIVWNGRVTFLELKHDGKAKGRLSPEQVLFKERVERAGYEWQSWRTIDECVNWLNARLKEIVENLKKDS